MRWGIVGAGKIAKRFASDLQYAPGARLAGVTSQKFANAENFSSQYKCQAFQTARELFEKVDIIYIATPHPLHMEGSLAAINAEKAVLCEKPFVMNYSEALTVIDLARRKNIFAMEAMWTRFFPAIGEIIEIVHSGELGEILSIESSFGYESQFDPSSRVFNLNLGGGSLLDVGVYSISLARMLIDEMPTSIESDVVIGASGSDETANWILRYVSGAKATGASSVINKLDNEAIIKGSKGTIRIPQFWCPKEYSLNGQLHSFEFNGRGFQFEAIEVMECLKNEKIESQRLPLSHTLDVMKIMDSIRAKWGLVYPFENDMVDARV